MINISTINYINIEDIKRTCIVFDEYSKIEQSLQLLYYDASIYPKIPCFSSIYEIDLHYINNSFESFIFNLSNCKDINLIYKKMKNNQQKCKLMILNPK